MGHGRQRVYATKPNAIDGLTLVAQLQRQMFLAHQALAQHLDVFAERGRGKALAPHLAGQRVGQLGAAVLGQQGAVGF